MGRAEVNESHWAASVFRRLMRMSGISILLVITTLLVAGSDAWWRRVVRVAQDVVTVGAAVSTVGAVVGRRAAACAESLTDEQAAQLAQQLAEMCPKLDFDPDVGLTRELLGEAFEAVDENDNGALAGVELETFSNVIQAFKACEDIAQAAEKQT